MRATIFFHALRTVLLICAISSTRGFASVSQATQALWNGEMVEFERGHAVFAPVADTSWSALSDLRSTYHISLRDSLADRSFYLLEFPDSISVTEVCAQLSSNPNTKFCCPNYTAKASSYNDPYWFCQWYARNTGAFVPGTAGIDIMLEEAHAITRGSPNVTIAVVDEGVMMDANGLYLTHPDLEDSYRISVHSRNFNNCKDIYGHGTMVAGIALAEANNTFGIAGICPECKGDIWKSREGNLHYFWYDYDAIIDAMYEHAQGQNCYSDPTVINLSAQWTIPERDRESFRHQLQTYFRSRCPGDDQNRNMLVCAVGNNGASSSPPPACFTGVPGLLPVGAYDNLGNFWAQTNRGPDMVLAPGGLSESNAPGVVTDNIVGSGEACGHTIQAGDLVSYFPPAEGTSISAAIVSGIAGLVFSLKPSLSNNDVWWTIWGYGADRNNSTDYDAFELHPAHANAFRALLYTDAEKVLRADLTVRKQPYVHCTYKMWNRLVVPAGKTLTFEAGARFQMMPSATIVVEDGGTLIVNGTESDVVEFFGFAGGGIVVNGGNITLNHAAIHDFGLTIQDGRATINNSEICYAEDAIRLLGSSVLHMTNSVACNCSQYGVYASFNSVAAITESQIISNAKAGVRTDGAAVVELKNSIIRYNGDGTWLSGGISGLSTGRVSIRCCDVSRNGGPGIWLYYTTLELATDWRYSGGPGHNDFSYNSYFDGQLLLSGCTVLLQNGANRIDPMDENHTYMFMRYKHNGGPPLNINGNFWGFDEPGYEDEIFSRILGDTQFLVRNGFQYATNWSPCSEDNPDNPSLCVQKYRTAARLFSESKFDSAVISLKDIIENHSDCYLAPSAANEILVASSQALISVANTRAYLKNIGGESGCRRGGGSLDSSRSSTRSARGFSGTV
jgi:hypothetical protein